MRKPTLFLIAVLALAGAATLYFWPQQETPQPQLALQPAAPEEPGIRYPIEDAADAGEVQGAPGNQLPSLEQSDGLLRDALVGLLGQDAARIFNLQGIANRAVATLDGLTRDDVSPRLMPVKPVPGALITDRAGESLVLSPRNEARYGVYVRVAEAVPTKLLVATYVQFYPLFQERYEQLGYPDKYFNDRVVHVIDHLLATPEVAGPVRLTQPRVLYEFADPELEGLSAGQKILVRMGNANAATVKAKLREIRSALVPKDQ